MSSTLRGRDRNKDDRYLTPAWCVHRLLDSIPWLVRNAGKRWIEPAVGNGAIIRAVNDYPVKGIKWTAVDKNPDAAKIKESCDVIVHDFPSFDFKRDSRNGTPRPETLKGLGIAYPWVLDVSHFDVAITNPPFALASEFLAKCRMIADTVCFLLRLNFIGGITRAAVFREDYPDLYILPNRPSFLPSGETDSIEYAWFVWGDDKGINASFDRGSYRILRCTPVEDRKRDARILFGKGGKV